MATALEIAREIGNLDDLKRRSKVVAFNDLPGVPEGTSGRISLVNGWDRWVRYRVLFDNGVDLGQINRPDLAMVKRYGDLVGRRTRAIESGVFDKVEQASSGAESASGEAAGGGGGDVVVNGVSIPGHLLERSSSARARLAG